MKKFIFVFSVLFLSLGASLQAQDITKTMPNIEEMPHYIVVKATDANAISRMQINIQIKKKSRYQKDLLKMEDWLYDLKGLRTISDLMNVMHEVGYEYVNAFTSDNNNDLGGGTVSYNLVFKKAK